MKKYQYNLLFVLNIILSRNIGNLFFLLLNIMNLYYV